MTHTPGPDDPAHEQARQPTQANANARQRAVGGMVTASIFAAAGTFIFAWALRAPDHPWLFAVGALPWVAGIILFGVALWRYTKS